MILETILYDICYALIILVTCGIWVQGYLGYFQVLYIISAQ